MKVLYLLGIFGLILGGGVMAYFGLTLPTQSNPFFTWSFEPWMSLRNSILTITGVCTIAYSGISIFSAIAKIELPNVANVVFFLPPLLSLSAIFAPKIIWIIPMVFMVTGVEWLIERTKEPKQKQV